MAIKDSTVKDLDDLHKKARGSRSKLEPEWYMNLAFYTGAQWLAWDGRQLYRPQMRRDRITITDNRIQPIVRTEIAKLCKNDPVFTVTPTSADDEDVNAAGLAEHIMRYLWVHLNMPEMRVKALEWSRICGAGFLKVFWDPTLGPGTDVCVGPDGQVLTDQQGSPVRADQINPDQLSQTLGVQVTQKTVHQGDIRVEVRSPFQMFCDPLADSFVECEWLIEESVKSTEQVKRRYDVEVPADTAANPGLIESRMGQVFQPGSGGYKGVKVREYWAKPSTVHPHGRRAVWCKDRLLFEDDKPFDCQPYIMLSSIQVPGRLWPESIVGQLRGPQTELNKVKSQVAENRNRVGNPTIVASKQAVPDPDKFASSMTMPGGIYFYDDTGSPNAVPAFLQAPQLPAYVLQEIERIEQALQEISGQHEVTQANVPPGVTAASAINLLQEADDTRIGPAVRDHEYQLAKLGQKILCLVAKYYTDARTIRIAGESGAWQVFDFRGAMIRNNTHVEVQAGSAFPQSKAAKQAAMQDLLQFFVQSGNPPKGKQLAQFLRDWEVGGAERLLEQWTRDETQINREHQRLAQGVPLPVNDYDNDPAHIEGHTDFQKSARYDQLPPQVKAVVEQHVQAHRDRVAAQQQAALQIQAQQAQMGAPDATQQAGGGSNGSQASSQAQSPSSQGSQGAGR